MGYKFGKRSMNKLNTCHRDLIKIHELSISRSLLDYSIIEGNRSIERQQKLFKDGKSKIDGITKKGKHNLIPSEATDIMIYHSDSKIRKMIAFDIASLCFIAGIIQSCADELYNKGEISHKIRWGGNWDMDGVIIKDQSFNDLVHFELI